VKKIENRLIFGEDMNSDKVWQFFGDSVNYKRCWWRWWCRDEIGLMVLELLEKGELQKLHKKWWFDKGECVVDDSKVL